MRVISIRGNHYKMGLQHGLQVKDLRPFILEAIEARFSQIEQYGPDARFELLLRETRELLQEMDAPLLAMIRGQAEALEFEFDTLLRYDLVTYLYDYLVTRKPPSSEGCTTWAATGSAPASGQPILVLSLIHI